METLANISQVFMYLLPIAGVITLGFLISVLIKMRGIMNNVNITVTGVNDAVGTTNGYLKELNTTVKSVNNMAMSVEAVRATTERAVKKAAKTASKQYDQVKTAVTEILEKTAAASKEVKEKDPKNIVRVASIEEKKPEEKAVEAVKEVIEAAENAVKE
ncbi:MAG: hypothetical protein IIZ74_00390 [Erysipelotrichaceae bacterium]|jgi:methyl-accepting chemotaxis protein|nr:hypothetical protein [Erysipelotrichaceae bacterium]MBQ3385408.1 hypothetical protein [Erysipelotrichaceae bacterium]